MSPEALSDRTSTAARAVVFWPLYCAISLLVTFTWFHYARTEILTDNAPYHFNSIVAMADGTAPLPFLRRRLMPDAASLLSRALPDAASPIWDELVALDERVSSHFAVMKAPISAGWDRSRMPLLGASLIVLAGSVLGFILVCSHLLHHLYVVSAWTADLLSALLGVALLGGCSDFHYQLYPYDFVQAFIFALVLLGMLKRQWWFVPAFLLAAYSKETAVLLVVAFALITWEPEAWRRWGWWLRLAPLGLAYLSIRAFINLKYPGFAPMTYWFPLRNARWLFAAAIFSAWTAPLVVVSVIRIVRTIDQLPAMLARVTLLIPIIVSLAFFKGWIEELRQYTEMLSIGGIVIIHWALRELGLSHLLVPREVARPFAQWTGLVDVRSRFFLGRDQAR
jgi:hypothetical protein